MTDDEYFVLAVAHSNQMDGYGAQPHNEETSALFGAMVDRGLMVKEKATSGGVEEDFWFVTVAGERDLAEWMKRRPCVSPKRPDTTEGE